MKDCKKCNQTVENCECHIPGEVKHEGLHTMCKILLEKKMYSREEVSRLLKALQNEIFPIGKIVGDIDSTVDKWIKENLK